MRSIWLVGSREGVPPPKKRVFKGAEFREGAGFRGEKWRISWRR